MIIHYYINIYIAEMQHSVVKTAPSMLYIYKYIVFRQKLSLLREICNFQLNSSIIRHFCDIPS